jgi:hypothetical protein
MKQNPEFGLCLNLVHHHRACCPATLSSVVSIHQIGVIL